MRKVRGYAAILAVFGLVALVGGLVLGANQQVNHVMSKAASGLSGGDSSAYTSVAPYPSTGGSERNPTLRDSSGETDKPPLYSAPGAFNYRESAIPSTGAGSSGSTVAPSAPVEAYVATDSSGNKQPDMVKPSLGQDPLRASEVDDNADYAAFIKYLNNYPGRDDYHNPDAFAERYFVKVMNKQQQPVADARVEISSNGQTLFDGRTTSDGRVVFFPQLYPPSSGNATSFDIKVSRDQATAATKLVRNGNLDTASVTLDTAPDQQVALDVVFVIDSTGSMGDEINKIKSTIHVIAQRIAQLPAQPQLRLALVTYRDRGSDNEFVTKKWDFTSDVNTFASELDTLVAYNGGDYPEDVNAGLNDAINLPGWSQSNGHNLHLAFLVGDAPPHLDYSDEAQYPQLAQLAASKGIKVFPIAASGLNDEGEFIFRQIAAATLGKFVFLTYADGTSGAAGDGTTMHVAGYQTNNLDDVVVRLISEEVANQSVAQEIIPSGAAQIIAAPPSGSNSPASGASNWLWLLALGWLLLPLAFYARREQRARGTAWMAQSLPHHEPKAVEPSNLHEFVRPARYWATAIGEPPTSRIGED